MCFSLPYNLRHASAAVVVASLMAVSCFPSRGNKAGAFCAGDADCEAGLCYNNVCLDPDGDEDGDSLKNGVENSLGTSPLDSDTDGDGTADNLEVFDVNHPKDGDGDGFINAIESSLPTADGDGDCLPDEFDPDNDTYTADMSKLAALFCFSDGVCEDGLDAIVAICDAGIVKCDYSSVEGYEEDESICDGADNDCDGDTDEELASSDIEACFAKGVCGDVADAIRVDCVEGEWVCKYGQVPDWEPEETRFDGLDNDCDGETDEGMAGKPCDKTNQHGTCAGETFFDGESPGCDAPDPEEETCDGVDNNCDGDTDEDLFSDVDGECLSEGVCGEVSVVIPRHCEDGLWICEYGQVPGYEAVEVSCDDKDNNCDGDTDEGLAGQPCDIENEFGSCPGLSECDGQGGIYCTGTPPAEESCDGADNDCDGDTDEGLDGLSCNIINQFGTCPGLTLCYETTLLCEGIPAVAEICDGADNDCDGDTDEDEICLKTATVRGYVKDGVSKATIQGATVTVLSGIRGGRDTADPIDVVVTDAEGRFEVFLKPGNYEVEIGADGYAPVVSWPFSVIDGDTMPLDAVMVPIDGEAQYIAVCGRVRQNAAESGGPPLAGASVTLYGNDFNNPLASTTSVEGGFYCITGVPGMDAGGQPFSVLALAAKMSGFLPGEAQGLPNPPSVVLIVNLSVHDLPEGTVTVLEEDFEGGENGWTTETSEDGVGWNWIENGEHMNDAVGECVMVPAQNEDCAPPPDDPTSQCALCEQPTDMGCIPEPGSLPNAYSGDHAFWFGNPASNNFLPGDGLCENFNGGKGGPVSGSLESPQVPVQGFTFLFLSFYSAWEVEAVDPQAPPNGFDWLLVEIRVDDQTTWDLVGYLNPEIDSDGKPFQPYTSTGFDLAPAWVNYYYDISEWAYGDFVTIRFRFDSKDENYNGFRGWLVDKVEIFGVSQG